MEMTQLLDALRDLLDADDHDVSVVMLKAMQRAADAFGDPDSAAGRACLRIEAAAAQLLQGPR
jgi:hypothetical protein